MKKSPAVRALTLIAFITLITVFLAYRGGFFENTFSKKSIVQTSADTSITSDTNSITGRKDSSGNTISTSGQPAGNNSSDNSGKKAFPINPTKQKRLISSSKSLILVDPASLILVEPELSDSLLKLLELRTKKTGKKQ